MLPPIQDTDLAHIWKHAATCIPDLHDARLFMTGGTGFFGCWLLESLRYAKAHLGLRTEVVVLTRDPKAFIKKMPHLAQMPGLQLLAGDVTNFAYPSGEFTHVIHAATQASVSLNVNHPALMLETIVQGTKHTLEFARQCAVRKFLLTSSGAVYGKQPAHLSHLHEDHVFHSEDIKSAYADGKREAEKICAHFAEQYNLDIKIARCFAFVGPHLPLDAHFAIGNFIRDGLNGHSIVIKSDGTPCRSYLYAADLVIWLWTILCRGETMRPYNVGSDQSITIKDLAGLIATTFEPQIEVHIEQAQATQLPERYVPDTSRARHELNLTSHIDLERAIQLTKEWYALHDRFKEMR